MARNFKQILSESFSKSIAYRIKFAMECTADDMNLLERSRAKYQFESA